MKVRMLTPVIVFFVVLGMNHSVTHACGTCINIANPFTLSHPRGIEIALATRACLDAGILKDTSFVSQQVAGTGRRLQRLEECPASLLVKSWSDELEPQVRQPLCIHFLFIDTNESCELKARGNLVTFAAQSVDRSDARLVTTRRTFHAITTGQITISDAIARGLLVLEGEHSTAVARLFQVEPRQGSTSSGVADHAKRSK